MNRTPDEVRTAIDTVLSGASHDPTLFNRVVNASKGDTPPVKKKLTLSFVFALVLVLLTATVAIAVTLGIPSLQQLIDHTNGRASEYDYEPFIIDNASIVTPTNQRETSNLVDVEIVEAYMTNEAFYLAIHVEPVEEDAILWSDSTPLIQNGKELRYFDLYKQEGIPLIEFGTLSLHSPYADDAFILQPNYIQSYRDPEATGITYLYAYAHPGKAVTASASSTLLGKFVVINRRTQHWEFNTLLFDLPPMTIVESHDSFLIN